MGRKEPACTNNDGTQYEVEADQPVKQTAHQVGVFGRVGNATPVVQRSTSVVVFHEGVGQAQCILTEIVLQAILDMKFIEQKRE